MSLRFLFKQSSHDELRGFQASGREIMDASSQDLYANLGVVICLGDHLKILPVDFLPIHERFEFMLPIYEFIEEQDGSFRHERREVDQGQHSTSVEIAVDMYD
jgi:hypothetical protein